MHKDSMDQEMKEIKEELKQLNQTLLRNTISLEHHSARTSLAEKRLDSLETYSRWIMGLLVSGVITIALKLLMK